jgi:hypothetical protein
MQLDLTPLQRDILAEILGEQLKELRHQIHHAAHPGFKQSLRQRESIVEDLLARLGGRTTREVLPAPEARSAP